jgi:hypothetical protein
MVPLGDGATRANGGAWCVCVCLGGGGMPPPDPVVTGKGSPPTHLFGEQAAAVRCKRARGRRRPVDILGPVGGRPIGPYRLTGGRHAYRADMACWVVLSIHVGISTCWVVLFSHIRSQVGYWAADRVLSALQLPTGSLSAP